MELGLTLNDLHKQIQACRAARTHGLQGLAEMSADDWVALERAECILEAMTEQERKNADLLLDEHVRQRIATVSGTGMNEVEELLSQVAKVQLMIRKIGSLKRTIW
jgi:signal recognition particle GTPase